MRRLICFCPWALLCAAPAWGGAGRARPGQVVGGAEGYGVYREGSLDQGLSRLWADAWGSWAPCSGPAWPRRQADGGVCCAPWPRGPGRGRGRLQAVNLAGVLAITALTMTDMAVMIGLGRIPGQDAGVFLRAAAVVAVLTARREEVTGAAVRQGPRCSSHSADYRYGDRSGAPGDAFVAVTAPRPPWQSG